MWSSLLAMRKVDATLRAICKSSVTTKASATGMLHATD